MGFSWSMTFTNFSSVNWSRSSYTIDKNDIEDIQTNTPSKTLLAHSGVEELALTQQGVSGFLGTQDVREMWCVWADPETGERFGIKIHIYAVAIGIGKAPDWYVMSEKGKSISGKNIDWKLSGSDPSIPREIVLGNHKITARPTVGDPSSAKFSLAINVIIDK
jgi:hypothetical protein